MSTRQPGAGRAGGAVRQFTVEPDDEGIRLDRWFKRHLPQVGFATLSRWARTGQIRVDGARARPDERLAAGQVLRVPPGGERGEAAAAPRPLSSEEQAAAEAMLIHRTQAALVLNKPPGLATQGGTGTTRHVDGLLDAFAGEDGPRPRLVHRLDKDTSGALLVARTPGSAAFFAKRFAGRGAKKIYWALVVGVPEIAEGSIDAPIAKQPGTGGEKMHVDMENGQPARTLYRVVDRAGNSTAWVELQPLTGRTHQLRVHMAAIGHPIVGDGKYGGQEAFLTGAISRKMHLHARRLVIEEPGAKGFSGAGGRLDVIAELPTHFAASMAQLGFDPAASDAAPDEGPPERSREEKKQVARQHAKQYRKARRGERQRRGATIAHPGKAPSGKAPSGKTPSGRAGVRTAGQVEGRPAGGAGGRPAQGKPAVRGPRRGVARAEGDKAPGRAGSERVALDRVAGRATAGPATSGKAAASGTARASSAGRADQAPAGKAGPANARRGADRQRAGKSTENSRASSRPARGHGPKPPPGARR